MKGKRYYVRGVKGFGISVFDDDGKKNMNVQLGLHKDNLPVLKGDYYNITLYPDQIKALAEGIDEIAEKEGVVAPTGKTVLRGTFGDSVEAEL